MSIPSNNDMPIAVVGGGPIGLAAAAQLIARGLPVKTDGEPARPRLWFVGFTPTLGGQLREGSIAARKVAAAVAASVDRGGRI